MYTHIYICSYIFIYIYIHSCIYIYIRICTCVCVYVYHIFLYTFVCHIWYVLFCMYSICDRLSFADQILIFGLICGKGPAKIWHPIYICHCDSIQDTASHCITEYMCMHMNICMHLDI